MYACIDVKGPAGTGVHCDADVAPATRTGSRSRTCPLRNQRGDYMRRAATLGVLVASGAISIAAAGVRQGQQPPPAKPVLEIQKLRDNLYLIGTGSGVGPNFIGGDTPPVFTQSGGGVLETQVVWWGDALVVNTKIVSD